MSVSTPKSGISGPRPTVTPKRPLWTRIPVVHQVRQSVGLQRGMLVAGLAIVIVFILIAFFRDNNYLCGVVEFANPTGGSDACDAVADNGYFHF